MRDGTSQRTLKARGLQPLGFLLFLSKTVLNE